MRSSRHHRGSAFILVVGLMVTLAMVGTVFFMITRADNKESRAVTEAAPMRTVAENELLAVRAALRDDLFINGNNGPYSDVDSLDDAYEYLAYMDYASPVADHDPGPPVVVFDEHLSASELCPADGTLVHEGHWARITNLAGFPPDAVVDVDPDPDPPNWPYAVVGEPATPVVYRTGTYDRNGEEYYAAIRLVDLSGLVNVNTAYELMVPTTAIPGMPLADLQLEKLQRYDPVGGQPVLPAFPKDEVHSARCGDNLYGFDRFAFEAGRRPENPDLTTATGGQYRLYDWADELACRRGGNTSPWMGNSRLYRAMETPLFSGSWGEYSRHLTTGSAGRIMPRPTDAATPNWEIPRTKVDLNLPLATPPQRANAFHAYRRAFYHMLSDVSPQSDRIRMAAQLAVNLIDYRDADDRPTAVHDGLGDTFSNIGLPGLGDAIVGVERQPFVSRVWLKIHHVPDDPATPNSAIS